MTAYWAEHAWLPNGPSTSVRFVVEDGRFESVLAHAHAQEGDVRLSGVVLPGLANTHSHAFHRALRGRTQAGSGNFWTWREQMYALTRRLTPETYFSLARAAFAEMVLAGFTVVGEFHYLHRDPDGRRYADPNEMGAAILAAASDAGVRLTLLDTCYLAGGLSGEGHAPLEPSQERFSDGSVENWLERNSVRVAPDPSVARLGAAIHSVRAVPKAALERIANAVTDMPLHVHLSEQLGENIACEMFYGCSPMRLLSDTGVLRPELTAVHATHLAPEDVKLLGAADAQASLCPTTERDLADGIGPARDLADSGVSLSVGSDQNAVVDPFEELRGFEMHERLTTNERCRFRPEDLVRIGSANGYRSLGWFDGGAIADGALADFLVVRDDSVRTIGGRAGQIVYTATAADVAMVVVGGRVVVDRAEHVRLGPVPPLYRDAFDTLRVER